MAHLFAGTSGFAYPTWKPGFYPPDVSAKNFLTHYASRLNSVEINYTFRRLPTESLLLKWIAATQPDFLFALKAPQRITHFLRLKNAGHATEEFLNSIEPLRSAGKLGPVLFQLPPQLQLNESLLREFLQLLPSATRCAFEFRHDSWFCNAVWRLLETRNAALCLAESEKLETPPVITSDFVYCRLRKPEYTAADIRAVALKVKALSKSGKDSFVYFKHEETPEGALCAEQLLRKVKD